ncbi:hypothetical protein BJ508DRAFT_341174, partial [Ascobolus immersus RN42]
ATHSTTASTLEISTFCNFGPSSTPAYSLLQIFVPVIMSGDYQFPPFPEPALPPTQQPQPVPIFSAFPDDGYVEKSLKALAEARYDYVLPDGMYKGQQHPGLKYTYERPIPTAFVPKLQKNVDCLENQTDLPRDVGMGDRTTTASPPPATGRPVRTPLQLFDLTNPFIHSVVLVLKKKNVQTDDPSRWRPQDFYVNKFKHRSANEADDHKTIPTAEEYLSRILVIRVNFFKWFQPGRIWKAPRTPFSGANLLVQGWVWLQNVPEEYPSEDNKPTVERGKRCEPGYAYMNPNGNFRDQTEESWTATNLTPEPQPLSPTGNPNAPQVLYRLPVKPAVEFRLPDYFHDREGRIHYMSYEEKKLDKETNGQGGNGAAWKKRLEEIPPTPKELETNFLRTSPGRASYHDLFTSHMYLGFKPTYQDEAGTLYDHLLDEPVGGWFTLRTRLDGQFGTKPHISDNVRDILWDYSHLRESEPASPRGVPPYGRYDLEDMPDNSWAIWDDDENGAQPANERNTLQSWGTWPTVYSSNGLNNSNGLHVHYRGRRHPRERSGRLPRTCINMRPSDARTWRTPLTEALPASSPSPSTTNPENPVQPLSTA